MFEIIVNVQLLNHHFWYWHPFCFFVRTWWRRKSKL